MTIKKKVLNLCACLGGNRFLWDDSLYDITAVELDESLAEMYQKRFPNDKVIVADAHQYLLDHYSEYDFIWSSPPCPSHSRARFAAAANKETKVNPIYPEMGLYQEILFLENYFDGKYVVENVIPYYTPLIPGTLRGRHLFWTNFSLPYTLSNRKVQVGSGRDGLKKLCEFHKIDLSAYKGTQRKDKIARNLVDYEAGLTIINAAFANEQTNTNEQPLISL